MDKSEFSNQLNGINKISFINIPKNSIPLSKYVRIQYILSEIIAIEISNEKFTYAYVLNYF